MSFTKGQLLLISREISIDILGRAREGLVRKMVKTVNRKRRRGLEACVKKKITKQWGKEDKTEA